MKFEKVDWEQFTNTQFKGKVKARYDKLRELFGDPKVGTLCDYGTQAEWCLFLGDDEEPVHIYDWYSANSPPCNYEWHIGGCSYKALDLVKEALEGSHV